MTEVQGGYDWLTFRDQSRAIVSTLLARRAGRGRAGRLDGVVGYGNVAFCGPWLRGDSEWRTNDELVVDKRYYASFLVDYVEWMEGDREAANKEKLEPWRWE